MSSKRLTARAIVFECRYLTWSGGGKKRIWTRWYPQFTVVDARTNPAFESGSPQFQMRQFMLAMSEKFSREWTRHIIAGRRPVGPCMRIRYQAARAR